MKTIEIINADVESGEIAPVESVGDFLELVSHDNFDDIFGQANGQLQRYIVQHAIRCREYFDRIIAGFKEHEDPSHWIAFRDWALLRKEVLEAPRETGLVTAGEVVALQKQIHDQAILIADNRLAFMRAETQEERDRINRDRRAEGSPRFGALFCGMTPSA